MKSQHFALVLSALLASPALAAAQDAKAFPVALVNMDKVFKSHKPFLDKQAPLKEAAAELEKDVQLRTTELETTVNKLRAAPPGSAESQKLQQQATKLQTELQQYVQKERDELQKRQVTVLLEFYRQVDDEVRKYAKAKGIKLVIRQQDTSLDENQPLPQIVAALNRGIVYEDGLDITDEILKALDARNSAATKP